MLGSSICKSISILHTVDSTAFKNGILLLESFLNGREPQSLKIKFPLPPPPCIQRHTPPLPRRPPRACTSSSKSSFNRNKNKDRRKIKSLGEWLVINRFYCILLELQSLFGHQNTKSTVVAQSISQPASNVSVLCYHVHGQLMTNSRSIGPNIKKNLLKPNRTAAELFLQQQFWTVMSTWISKKTFPIRSVLCSSKQVSYNIIHDKYVSNSTVPSNTPSNKICLVQVNVCKKMDHWGKNPKCFHLKVGYGWLPYFYRGGKKIIISKSFDRQIPVDIPRLYTSVWF